ncbi:IucA/IucC family protein [Streptomyces sp. NPDC002309]
MTTAPTPDRSLRTPAQRRSGSENTPLPTSTTAPAQHDGRQEAEHLHGTATDPLDHPDALMAADATAVENLLRCWVRETDLPAPDHGILRIPLPASGTELLTPVHYWSRTGSHRFGLPRLASAPAEYPPLDAVTVASLLARETPRGTDANAHGCHEGTDLVGRVADSVRRVATFIGERRQFPADEADLFLGAEQALLLGHPLHPTPKSREGLTEAEAPLWSPELRGSFSLHWMAVAPCVLAGDSAWTERGRAVPAPRLTAQLAGVELPLPGGYAALPLHPWQMRELRHRSDVAALLDAGLLRDLGAHGAVWHPTSSVRTVYQPGAAAMLKLSLGLRITNSRRENLRKELHRGVEAHRLLRSGLAQQWQSVHPCFDIVRDPAWLAVDGPDGSQVPGLDVMIRHNPFAPADDIACLAGLTALRPQITPGRPAGDSRPEHAPQTHHPQHPDHGKHPDHPQNSDLPQYSDFPQYSVPWRHPDQPSCRSRLAAIVSSLAGRTGRPRGTVAAEWFLRYLEQVVRPVLWLDAEAGVALEAHQQNTLVLLDSDGWPAGGRYRDNQGFYFRESRRAELASRLPGIGEHSDTFVSDEVADERFTYYLAINNVFGLIGAFGSQHLADERLLLAAFRRFLESAASGPSRLRTSLPSRLLDSPVLRCKANLLTRLYGLDELTGPVDTQSVYVTIANPLRP